MARDARRRTDEFFEVFVDAPLDVAEGRDPKGLYKKARRGELQNFTGIDAPYERPRQPDLRIDTTAMTAEEAADAVVELLSGPGRQRERQRNGATVRLPARSRRRRARCCSRSARGSNGAPTSTRSAGRVTGSRTS